jgi:alpha-mannosidase
MGGTPHDPENARLEQSLEELGEQPTVEQTQEVDSKIAEAGAAAARRLSELVMSGGGSVPGYLVFNPLGFRRMVTVEFPEGSPMPAVQGPNTWLQWDDTHRFLTLDVAGAGFAWIPSGNETPPVSSSPPMAEPDVLRNEFFEVRLSEETGGIGQIKGYGRSPNRLSQQVTYRYSRERTWMVGEGEAAEEVKSHYAEMRRESSTVTSAGPALGEIVVTGEIVDQKTAQRLAGFRQTYRVWRGRPVVEIDLELDIEKMPDAEPWHNYYTARFAWNDDTASLTRSAMSGAQEVVEDRIESPHYIEIATAEQRTTILPCGLPFHRKSGPRMLDTILVVPRETQRRFRFVIAIDQNYPMQGALDALSPAVVVPTTGGPPRSGGAGWFFHINARSVQMLQILPLIHEPLATESWSQPEPATPAEGHGCAVRLVETEGRPIRAKLRCVLAPTRARQRNFLGKTICELPIEGDAVFVDLTAYEIADIEIRFDRR